jgi:integrase/recombinase XerC
MPETSQEVRYHLAHLTLRELSPKTISQRRYVVLDLARYLERTRCTTLLGADEADLNAWQTHKSRTRSGHGMRNCVMHAAQFYAWAARSGLIPADPALNLVRPKAPRCLPRPIGLEDLDAALTFAPERIAPWLTLAVEAGMRAKEIAGLTAADLLTDFDPPLIRVLGKGGKERLVPMTPTVEQALRGLPRRGPLFHRMRGDGPVSASIVSEACNRYLHSIGIESTLHTLRHRAGTDWNDQCQDIRVVQELLGHASPATTAIYTKFSNVRAVDVVLAVSSERRSVTARSDTVASVVAG